MGINLDSYFEMMDLLFNEMPFAFWKDRSGVYLGGSTNQAKEFGFETPKDFIGKNIYEILEDQETARLIDIDDNDIMENGKGLLSEAVIKTPNGEKTYLSQKHPIRDSEGNVIGLFGFSIDVTELKKFEQIAKIQHDKFRTIVKQVIHDITSPITSINVIVSRLSNNVPEADRVTLRHAAMRISGISQRLLGRYNDESLDAENGNLLVSLALLQIINEKREEHRNSNVFFEVDIDEDANFIFIKHNQGIFKRMLSNLVNNAVDALKASDSGKVAIHVGVHASNVVITVQDNGLGMPLHIIEKFNQGIAVTEGKKEGHGVGLTQIRDAILSGDGTFKVHASMYGTRITIRFPIVETPNWLAKEINLRVNDTVIILDDDESIHGSWDRRFEDVVKKNPTLKIKHFYEGNDVILYVNSLTPEQKKDVFLLTDLELLEQGINGFEVILQTQMSRSVLVTSYSLNEDKQLEAIKASISILPKEFVSNVKIKLDKQIPFASKKVDMVWVEDQKWYIDDIVNRYYSHLKVDKYYDPISFMEGVLQYSLDTKIILDTYYESSNGSQYNITGYDMAHELYGMGFTNLIVLTGESPGGRAPVYLKIARKIDGHVLKNLDKL